MSLIFDLFRHDPCFVTIMAGKHLFRENERSEKKMYALFSGVADILINDRLVEKALPGSIVGEMGIVEPDQPHATSVCADSNCEFGEIDLRRFELIVAAAPFFALEIMRKIAHRQRAIDRLLDQAPAQHPPAAS